jgi:hypothetical protein
MTTPRLHLHIINRAGNKELIGDFADGPMGRRQADKAEREAYRQNEVLQNYIERDPSNDYRPGDEKHSDEYRLLGGVQVTRVFGKNQVQALLRIPKPGEATPRTIEDATTYEERNVEQRLRGKQFEYFPLTNAEQSASDLVRKDPQQALLKADGMSAHRQALADASTLQANTQHNKTSQRPSIPAGPGSLMAQGGTLPPRKPGERAEVVQENDRYASAVRRL